MLAKEKCCAVCLSCGNTLEQNEQPIKALRGKWHPACFKCSECKRVLSSVYFARDNLLFCRKDYFMKFRSTCHACERIITGPVMVVADHKFHTECFSCWYCQRFLGEEDNYAILERHRLVCFLCLKKDLEQPWWSSSLHAVYHFHLTAFNCERHKIEVEVVKSARGVPLQSACTQKEPNQAIIVIKGFNLKEFGYNMPVVSPGDVVLEVNRVVVSPNSIDRVATLLTSRPEEITQITVEHNETGFQAKSNSRRKHSSDSDSEPNDDKNVRTRSISLFSRRHLAQLAPSLSAEIYSHNGEVTFDVNGKKITKPAMRSNSLPRSNSCTDALRERSAIHRAQSFKQETVSNRVFRPCDLVIGDVIGKGFFGQVRKVTHRETGEVMVLKEMLHYDEDASSGFLKEVALLKSLNHPNVLRFIGILYRDKVLNLIIEYISGGTLRQILKDKGKELSWLQRVKFAKDIAAGMAYLHSMSVMHRDLNSRNCLVATDEGSGEMSVVVADFGLARVVRDRPASPNHHLTSSLWPSSAGSRPPTCPGQKPPPPKKRYTVVGSPYWMAPEMLNGLTYNEQVDVFSFGITMCEIIGRVKADPDYMPRTSKFGLDEKKFKAEFCESCPELFYKIAFLCCDLDPDKRYQKGRLFEMEAKDVIKWSVMGFLTLFFFSGLSLIVFAVTIPTPFGDYLTMKGAAFPMNYPLRIALLILLPIITASSFFAITKENNRLLTLLGVLFIILFLVEFILAILYFTMASEVNLNKKKFSNGMQMMGEYGVDEKVTEAFDRIQRTYACCGILDYRDWFTSKWAASQGVNNRVPSSCCKFPSPTCGYDMDTKNPIDVINILGCSGLNFSYEDRKKFVGGVGLAIGLLNLFASLCCIVFIFCFNSARGLSPVDALKGVEPSDDPGRRGSSVRDTPQPKRRPQPKSVLRTSKENLTEDNVDDDDDLPLDAYKDLRDKSQM